MRANATGASVGTTATAAAAQAKPWKQKLNPLRWGRIPPIPEERIQSREYGASIFSKLFFNWVTPLMTVGGCLKMFVAPQLQMLTGGFIGRLQETTARARPLVGKPG